MTDEAQTPEPETEPTPPPAKPKRTNRGRTVRLAQNIQLRVKGEPVILLAGQEIKVGKGPYDVDPEWLERQPLLDLDHEHNQAARSERSKVLSKIARAQAEAAKRGHDAVQRIGRRDLRFGEHGIV